MTTQTSPLTGAARVLVLCLGVGFAGIVLGLRIHDWMLLRTELDTPGGQLQLAQQDLQTGHDQQALALFTKQASQRSPLAQYWLARMTELGIGMTNDPAKAVELYKKAAAQGSVAAQKRLGEIYLHGNIVPPDFEAARTYLEKAALHGNSRAALLLGQIYRLGLGTPSDPTESFAWYEVATLEHSTFAPHERKELLARLNPQQQEAAVTRVKAIMSAISNKTALPATSAPAAKTAPVNKGSSPLPDL